MITLNTLKEKGFALTKECAQELHSAINWIAQHGNDGLNIVFHPPVYKAVADPVKEAEPEPEPNVGSETPVEQIAEQPEAAPASEEPKVEADPDSQKTEDSGESAASQPAETPATDKPKSKGGRPKKDSN